MGENTVVVTCARWRRLNGPAEAVKITVDRHDSRFIYASIALLEEHLLFGVLRHDCGHARSETRLLRRSQPPSR